jgi:hypothetical protein
MRFLGILLVAIVSFGAGVWYMGGFVVPEPTPIPQNPTPTPTPLPVVQATYENADANMIRVETPLPGAAVSASFSVQGAARGGWYFEANFPYQVFNAQGALLAEGPVTASGEWMTPEFVPFSFTVSIPGYVGPATLILRNDNASGLPENDASVSIPIVIQ